MKNEQTYKIKPLKWEKNFAEWSQQYTASTPFGSYIVQRHKDGDEDDSPWATWKWGYCFDEYYDEAEWECATALYGKAAAEANWQERLVGALIPLLPVKIIKNKS